MMKRFSTLLGVFAVGEGFVLILLSRRYLGFWVKTADVLMGKVRPALMENPRVPRLLGVAEMGLGLWLVLRRLGSRDRE